MLLRRARPEDVPAIASLLAADQHGAVRDGVRSSADLTASLDASWTIDTDPSELLLVARVGADVAGTLLLSFLHGLARRGASRCQVEAVRVRRNPRGLGLGASTLRSVAAGDRRLGACSGDRT